MTGRSGRRSDLMVSEFYERKRRLAYLFAVLSVGILAVQLYLGALLGVFSHPRIASDVDRVYVLHRSASQEESESGSRLIFLDASLEPARAPYRLSGHAGGLAPDPEGLVLYFGTRYSEPLGATFLDEDGKEKPILGGSYGIGLGRVMAAAVEQRNDEHGIAGWPRTIAPYDAHVVVLPGLEQEAEEVAERLEEQGFSVLLDDRDLRAGEMFADADLIGCPVRITVGKRTLEDEAVDVRDRATGEERRVPIKEVTI